MSKLMGKHTKKIKLPFIYSLTRTVSLLTLASFFKKIIIIDARRSLLFSMQWVEDYLVRLKYFFINSCFFGYNFFFR